MAQVSISLIIFLLHVISFKYSSGANHPEKKGLSFGGDIAFSCDDVPTFQNLNWYYNWDVRFHPECPEAQPKPGNFVPMLWGYYGTVFDIDAYPYDTILGFNEPNHPSQSNLSPEKAAYGWIEVQEQYPGKILVSPAAAPGGWCTSEEWFDEFFAFCQALGCRIDYLATHSYSCDAQGDIDYLNSLYERYGLKIWYTEFACPNTRDPAVALAYMQQILPLLDNAESVAKYAWFISRFGPGFEHKNMAMKEGYGDEWYLDKCNSLLEIDASEPILTPLGVFYDQF